MTETWLSHEKYFKNEETSASPTTEAGGSAKSSSKSSTKTGDETNVLPYILGLLGGIIIVVIILLRKKRSGIYTNASILDQDMEL